MNVSNHARKRWTQRAQDTTLDITTAWEKAQPLEHVSEHFTKGSRPDERARIYSGVNPSGSEIKCILIAVDGALKTCYEYTGESDSRVEAYVETIVRHTTYYE